MVAGPVAHRLVCRLNQFWRGQNAQVESISSPARDHTIRRGPGHFIFLLSWETWIRTMIHGSKGRCPTIRRSPNKAHTNKSPPSLQNKFNTPTILRLCKCCTRLVFVMEKIKTPKQMERHLRGVANHYRIQILLTVAKQDGITLEDLVITLKANQKTTSEHTRRLVQAGLLNKNYRGRFVEHTLSPYGRLFVQFLKSLQKI